MKNENDEPLPSKVRDELDHLRLMAQITDGMHHTLLGHLSTLSSMIFLLDHKLGQVPKASNDILKDIRTRLYTCMGLVQWASDLRRSGSRAPTKPPFDLVRTIRQLVASIQKRLSGTSIVFSSSLPEQEQLVLGDPVLLSEALQNIISNAIWAIRANRGSADRTLHLDVSRESGGQQIRVEIRDSGIGIDQDMLEKVFTPYFTTKSEGSGLGLYLASVIVKRFGGSLFISHSEPKKGTTVTLTLPLYGSRCEGDS